MEEKIRNEKGREGRRKEAGREGKSQQCSAKKVTARLTESLQTKVTGQRNPQSQEQAGLCLLNHWLSRFQSRETESMRH